VGERGRVSLGRTKELGPVASAQKWAHESC